MGEIKSTLDLVMERTQHLSLSKEERTRQQRSNFEKRLQGLLLQYAEGSVQLDTLRKRIATLQAETRINDERLLLQTIFKRLDPDADNGRWMDLLAETAPQIRDSLQEILADYRGKRAGLLAASDQRLQVELADRRGIKGSAVVPNVENDSRYLSLAGRLLEETEARIDAVLKQTS